MKKIWIILKTEFINTITRRSYLLVLILVPLIPALILTALSLFSDDAGPPGLATEIGGILSPDSEELVSDGYVDQANVLNEIPVWIEEGRLIPFSTETQAQEAVQANEIRGFYMIPPNYFETGEITYYRDDFNPITAMEETWVINNALRYNLLGANLDLFELYEVPLHVQWVDLSPDDVPEVDPSNMAVFYIPYGMTMLFYVLIVTTASMMMNNLAKEKENRMMEILMSSITPHQLLTGKILGLGLVGLFQLFVWLGSAYLMLHLGGTTLNIPPALQPSPVVLIWGGIYFILGYLVYATLMAGVGALVPNVKEATQATFLIILPMLIPLLMIGIIINRPNSALSVILSLFPFTAPNTMMTRVAAVTVPLWQLLLSIGLLVITVIILIRAVAGMFRAQLLLTGKKFSVGLYLNALIGKSLD